MQEDHGAAFAPGVAAVPYFKTGDFVLVLQGENDNDLHLYEVMYSDERQPTLQARSYWTHDALLHLRESGEELSKHARAVSEWHWRPGWKNPDGVVKFQRRPPPAGVADVQTVDRTAVAGWFPRLFRNEHMPPEAVADVYRLRAQWPAGRAGLRLAGSLLPNQ